MRNREDCTIDPRQIDAYGFHKWIAERIVEKYASCAVIFRCGTAVGTGLKKGPVFDLLNGKPLFMSPESTLSLIDTTFVAQAVTALVAEWPSHAIINLTGTGPVKVADLAAATGGPCQVVPGGEEKIHRYHVNNVALQAFLSVPSSLEIGQRFIARWRST